MGGLFDRVVDGTYRGAEQWPDHRRPPGDVCRRRYRLERLAATINGSGCRLPGRLPLLEGRAQHRPFQLYDRRRPAADIYVRPGSAWHGADLPPGRQRRGTQLDAARAAARCVRARPSWADVRYQLPRWRRCPMPRSTALRAIDDPTFSIAEYGGAAQAPYGRQPAATSPRCARRRPTIDGWGYGAMAEALVGFHSDREPDVPARRHASGTCRARPTRPTAAPSSATPADTDADGVYDTDPDRSSNAGFISTEQSLLDVPLRPARRG